MSTWYRINKYTARIDSVEVKLTTDKYITLAAGDIFNYERRVAKQNEYFPTFREARKALMDYYSEQHKQLLYQAELIHEEFIKVFMMDEENKA